MSRLYEVKNHDYGDSFAESFRKEGLAMPRIRLGDKLRRFESISRSNEQRVKDESMVDTLIDLATYSVMTVLEMSTVDDLALFDNSYRESYEEQ